MLQMLPAGYREALTENRSKLNTQPSLNGMLDLFAQAKVGGAATVPFDLAGVGSKAGTVSHPPRLVMRSKLESTSDGAARHLSQGCFVVTRDRLGVADALGALLAARGREVAWIEADALVAEGPLIERCGALGAAAVGGVLHLAALGTPGVAEGDGPVEWRSALQKNEKSLFVLLRELDGRLGAGAHALAASDLGGLFGREGTAAPEMRLLTGAVGALKSYREERSDLHVKAVDLDIRRGACRTGR